MKIGRNEPCFCGSDKKYKKCCRDKESPLTIDMFKNSDTYKKVEPHIDFPNSIIYKGKRIRALGNKIIFRPTKETFHEFIIQNLMTTFGQKWYDNQKVLPLENQHVVYKWYVAYIAWKKVTSTEANKVQVRFKAFPNGEVQALLILAYDIYCLQAFFLLPSFLLKRLRSFIDFQSARYEILAAAVMKRAGYDIDFLDSKIKNEKHCEFIATNKRTGVQVGVEAKSRRRTGVLNEKGEINDKKLIIGDFGNLLFKALKQKPDKLPYFIFIDLNMLPFDETNPFEKPWFNDVKKIFDKIGKPTAIKPDKYNALFLTNFPFHYGASNKLSPKCDHITTIPLYSESPFANTEDITNVLSNPYINEVIESLNRYNKIPKEI